VVSYDQLKKGKVERPRSGLDRLTLTEVGSYVFDISRKMVMEMKLRRANPPFPWEMAFFDSDVEISHLDAYFIGPSTFRSIFRFSFLEGTRGKAMASSLIQNLDRDPLNSDYWNMDTWARFKKNTGLSMNEVIELNENSMRRL
jgi:hypothetical protein